MLYICWPCALRFDLQDEWNNSSRSNWELFAKTGRIKSTCRICGATKVYSLKLIYPNLQCAMFKIQRESLCQKESSPTPAPGAAVKG